MTVTDRNKPVRLFGGAAWRRHGRHRQLLAEYLLLFAGACLWAVELPIAQRAPLGVSLQLESRTAVGRGAEFLLEQQMENGSWRGSPLLTSLALGALAQTPEAETEIVKAAIQQALDYLENGESGTETTARSPTEKDGERPSTSVNHGGLSRQAKTVLRIMTAVQGEQKSPLNELTKRAMQAGQPPLALEAAVVTAVRMRECLDSDAENSSALSHSLCWAHRYYGSSDARGVDKQQCRTFIYVLGRAVQAIRANLPKATDPGSLWRQQTAIKLLNAQKGGGQWACQNSEDGGAVASTAFALLVFGQVISP